MSFITHPPCPLCLSSKTAHYHQDKRRHYLQCSLCQLVFVSPDALPDAATERQEYDLHQNTPDDPGYQRFLSRLTSPLLTKLPPSSKGLDFGCGPGPALAQMLENAGHNMALYDPFYQPDTKALEEQYDFICCTEAIEHFHTPYNEWQLWQQMLKPEGWLAIMTKRVESPERFASWHYKNDMTHVSFFSEYTFAWLARQWQMTIEFTGNDVVLMQKLA